MMKPFIPRAPIIMASIIGTFVGTLAIAGLLLAFGEGAREDTFAAIWSLLLFTGLLVPISAFGILIFGYPAAAAVGDAWNRAWVGIAALLMGALAGFITRVTLVSLFAGGFARADGGPLPVDAGIIYGAAVGVTYWLFERDWRLRDAARRAAEGPGEEIPTSEEFARLP